MKQGLFEFYSSFQEIRIHDGPASIDFCIVNEDEYTMVYTIDLDGSMKPTIALQNTNASTLVGSDDGRLLAFVDLSKCTKVEAGCYSYCSDTCFRSMRFELDVPFTEKYSLKVCLRDDHSNCTMFEGGRRATVNSYTLIAHLPVGNTYDAIFVSTNGNKMSPSFQQSMEESFCPPDSLYDVTILDDGLEGVIIDALPRKTSFFQGLVDLLVRILQALQP